MSLVQPHPMISVSIVYQKVARLIHSQAFAFQSRVLICPLSTPYVIRRSLVSSFSFLTPSPSRLSKWHAVPSPVLSLLGLICVSPLWWSRQTVASGNKRPSAKTWVAHLSFSHSLEAFICLSLATGVRACHGLSGDLRTGPLHSITPGENGLL